MPTEGFIYFSGQWLSWFCCLYPVYWHSLQLGLMKEKKLKSTQMEIFGTDPEVEVGIHTVRTKILLNRGYE